jgi:hypothetical protein
MKYVKFIFENQNVQQTILEQEQLVEFASQVVINYNLQLESYIYNSLELYISEDLNDTYNNIRNFIIQENLNAYNYISEVLADSDLTPDDKFLLIESLHGITSLLGSGAKNAAKEAITHLKLANPGVKLSKQDIIDHMLKSNKHNSKGIDHGVLKRELNKTAEEVSKGRFARKAMEASSRKLPGTQVKMHRSEFKAHKETKAALSSEKDAHRKTQDALSLSKESAKNWRRGALAASGATTGSLIGQATVDKQYADELKKTKQQVSDLTADAAKNKKVAGIGKFGLYKNQD